MVKSLSKILLITFFLSSQFFAQELDALMESGNSFYQNKDYENAIKSYESILNQGYLSSELYYNLGNSYFRIGNLGKSILYYEKSLKLEPGNEDASYNLRIAKARTVDKIQEIPPIFIVKWWNMLLAYFSSSGWQVVVIIFYILLLVCIGLYFLIKNLQVQKFSFLFGVLNLAAFILSIILFISSLTREASQDFGVVQKQTISVKISPDQQSNDAFVIHEGTKFEIEEKLKSWAKIKLVDGKVGWLPNSSFEVI